MLPLLKTIGVGHKHKLPFPEEPSQSEPKRRRTGPFESEQRIESAALGSLSSMASYPNSDCEDLPSPKKAASVERLDKRPASTPLWPSGEFEEVFEDASDSGDDSDYEGTTRGKEISLQSSKEKRRSKRLKSKPKDNDSHKTPLIKKPKPAGQNDLKTTSSELPPTLKRTITKEAQKIKNFLFKSFKDILNRVERIGYWDISSIIQNQQIPENLLRPQKTPTQEEIAQSKRLFEEVPHFLERFCHLKIQEIAFYMAQASRAYRRPQSDIQLSILYQMRKEIEIQGKIEIHEETVISEVSLHFCDEGLALFPKFISKKSYSSVLEALFDSSWLVDEDEKTIIRFSDHPLEGNLIVKRCCGKLDYALLSTKITEVRNPKELNFWENLAFYRKKNRECDLCDIQVVTDRLQSRKSKDPISIDETIKRLAFTKEIQQERYVQFVLKNCREGKGTLLNLPTGFGKTFIIFMAAAQQMRTMRESKPYLVITPAVNVMESWKENYTILQNAEREDSKFFPDKNEPWLVKETDDFNNNYEYKRDKTSFIVMTAGLLRNLIKDKLSVEQEVERCIGNNPQQILFLQLAGILSKNKFILGNERTWVEATKKVFETKSFGLKALETIDQLRLQAECRIREDRQEFFNPIHRGEKKGFKRDIKVNRDKFVESLKELKNELRERLNEVDSKFSDKLFSKDDDETALEKLFDYCWFWQSCTVSKKTEDGYFPSIDKLKELARLQQEKVTSYEKFKTSFGGIILDESDQIFSLKSTGPSDLTEMLLDISKTFQSVSELGRLDNPLIIASSATPWPNAMQEFKLHMEFLLPRIIGEFSDLNNNLFWRWDQFEISLDISRERQPKDVAEQLRAVQRHFYPWVKLLFEETTCYEASEGGAALKTNLISDNPVYVECEKECQVKVKGDILSLIKNFYSKVLKEGNSNIRDFIFAEIEKNPTGKFAFFVELTEDAARLSMDLSNHFEENAYDGYSKHPVQIGFFHNEEFVKKQGGKGKKGVEARYTNITYNTDRMLNIHAFNNIFHLEDFYRYLDQHFYFGEFSIAKEKALLRRIVSILDPKIKEESEKKSMGPEGALSKLVNKLSRKEELTDKEQKCVDLLEGLISLETQSNSGIIEDFKTAIDSLLKKLNRNHDSFLEKLTETDRRLQEARNSKPTTLFGDQLEDLEGAIFHYLNKISLSNILIFGNAGTSGMRIDADHLFILSGAWTEGKLSQIKGRVGRPKSSKSQQRLCKVHSPITNTNFEYLVLRYYIKKSLYNSFLRSKIPFQDRDLCSQLDLSGRLYTYYSEMPPKDFVSETLHRDVQKEMTKEKRNYLGLSPYDKALAIVPGRLLEDSREFVEKILSSDTEPGKSVEEELLACQKQSLAPPLDLQREIGKAPPTILPITIESSSQEERESLRSFPKGRKTILIIVPTRARTPDLPVADFFDHVNSSLSEEYCAIIIFGVNQMCNHEDKDDMTHELQEQISASKQSLQKKSIECVFPKILPFLWFENHRKEENGRPPVGAMRNHCLIEAQRIWSDLDPKQTFFFSMDGDTELTKEAFERMIKKVDQSEFPYTVATGGYGFALPDHTSNEFEWSHKSNEISMEINSKLLTLDQGHSSYYGYPAEPLIGLSPSLTELLFQGDLIGDCQKGDLQAPLGYHDNEGRRLYRYLRNKVNLLRASPSSSSSTALVSYGPPKNQKERPILHNYARFLTRPPSYKTVPLKKEQLAKVIERLHGQSQQSISPWFMGSNIAYAWEVDRQPIRKFCGHFYAKALLNLLGLGPERGKVLSKKVLEMFKERKEPYSNEDQTLFQLEEKEWTAFVETHFGLSHLDSLRKEKAQVGIAVAKWATSVFERLEHHFGKSYEEEKEGETYNSMATPHDYPKRAIELSEKDREESRKSPAQAQEILSSDENDIELMPVDPKDESTTGDSPNDVNETGNQISPIQSLPPVPDLGGVVIMENEEFTEQGSPNSSLVDVQDETILRSDQNDDKELMSIDNHDGSAIEDNPNDANKTGNQSTSAESLSPVPDLEGVVMMEREGPSILAQIINHFDDCEILSTKNYFDKIKFPEVKKLYSKKELSGNEIVVTIVQFSTGVDEKKRAKKILIKITTNPKSHRQKRDYLAVCISGNQEKFFGYFDYKGGFQYTKTPPDWYKE